MSEVVQHYYKLHAIPEPGMQEFKTAAYVATKLEQAGYQVTRQIGGTTGVLACYDSGLPGPVLGLRADMDALTHIIDGKKIYRHTCGHDGHMAMLLTAAEQALPAGLVKRGRVKFLFQPAEEIGSGAMAILKSGVIDDMDILVGMHIRPRQECAAGEIISAMLYSATCILQLTLQGKTAHGARPHLGVNALDAAVAAINAVNAIHMDPRLPFSVKATRLHADAGAFNAIPGQAVLTLDLRAQTNQVMEELREKTLLAVTHGAASVGALLEKVEEPMVHAAGDCIAPEVTKILAACAAEVVGKDKVLPPFATSGGEDFFHYAVSRPQLKVGFTGLGVGAEPGLHHPDMHFDPRYLEDGVQLHLKTIDKILGC